MLKSLAMGAVAGGLIGGIVYALSARALDQQLTAGTAELAADLGVGGEQLRAELARGREELRAQIRRQVPPLVTAELERTLLRYGITPATGRRVAYVLEQAERAGLI